MKKIKILLLALSTILILTSCFGETKNSDDDSFVPDASEVQLPNSTENQPNI